MAGKSELQIYIKGHDEASRVLKTIGGNLDGLSRQCRNMGLAFLGMATAVTAGLGMMIKKYVEAGDQIQKMAIRTGFSTELLSKLKYMADISGTSLESLAKGIKTMNGAILDASEGMDSYIRIFNRLGLNIQDLLAMPIEERFWAIAMAIGAIEDPGIRSATAIDVFGRAGEELIPLLDLGSAGIQQLTSDAEKFATVYSQDAANACATVNDAMTALKSSISEASGALAKQFLPELENIIKNITAVVLKIGEWIEAHPILGDAIKQFIIVLGVLGGALLAIWGIIKLVNIALMVMHALSGPWAWAKMLAGLAAVAGMVYAMNKLMEEAAKPPEEITKALEEIAGGGVPAPTAPSVPAPAEEGALTLEEFLKEIGPRGMQAGGIVTRPTLALLGERGAEAIVPLGTAGISTREVHIHLGTLLGDEFSLRKFARMIKQIMGEDDRRTSFSGINKTYFYGGSHV